MALNPGLDPPPLHGKCHLKFPFWLFEPFPKELRFPQTIVFNIILLNFPTLVELRALNGLETRVSGNRFSWLIMICWGLISASKESLGAGPKIHPLTRSNFPCEQIVPPTLHFAPSSRRLRQFLGGNSHPIIALRPRRACGFYFIFIQNDLRLGKLGFSFNKWQMTSWSDWGKSWPVIPL